MSPKNLLIIMVDQMAAKAVGCYGHPTIKTPHIDALAARGVRFTNAYTNSPICIPARASMATGRYPHETGYWDNVFAYDGKIQGWGHRLQTGGYRHTTIGKLHYKNETCPTGIDEQIHPMHVFGGGDLFGLERENPPARPQSASVAGEVKAGDSQYTRYDQKITELTESWFASLASSRQDKPWVTFTSFIAPHFPLTVPQRYIDLYDSAEIKLYNKQLDVAGPLVDWWRKFKFGYNFDEYFEDDSHRRKALLHYYALCSFADENVGRVLQALESSGQANNTTILFLSDHGDHMGARGLWGKSTMFEESANVPLILVDNDLSAGTVCETPVSLVDVYPTVLATVGEPLTQRERDLPGKSLHDIAATRYDPERAVFSEYHASCAPTGLMMLRKGRYKYIYYTHHGAQLFDLTVDPEEIDDLAASSDYSELVAQFEAEMRAAVDPELADAAAKIDQRKRLTELGGIEKIIAAGGVTHTPPPGETASII